MEKTLSDADPAVELSRWQRHCIYRVPAGIKDLNPKAYRPQRVSLGPFHHGDAALQPMEGHKRRALRHLLRRSRRPLEQFVFAVEEVMEELENAYLDLDDRWRGAEGRERFLEMMIVDGCFVLEVIRAATGRDLDGDYAPNDPIFSRHGVLYVVPYIRRDILLLENQLPLLLLAKLFKLEKCMTPGAVLDDSAINKMVLRFVSPTSRLPPATANILGLHPLEVYRRSMLYVPQQQVSRPCNALERDIIRSAVELYESGIRFVTNTSGSLQHIRFRRGVLTMPAMSMDDSTEYVLLNMMAFESLFVGAGNDVVAYVYFLSNILKSAKDVVLLSSLGIIQNNVGSEEAVLELLKRISTDVVLPDGALDAVNRQVNAYCRQPWNRWRANLVRNYFRTPTSFFNFLAGSIALVMTVMQTIYAVVQFYKGPL